MLKKYGKFTEFVQRWILPAMGEEALQKLRCDQMVPAVHLEGVPLPSRSSVGLFEDKLPMKPMNELWVNTSKIIGAGAMAVLYLVSSKALKVAPFAEMNTYNGGPLKTVYTGSVKIDTILSAVVSGFSVITDGTSAEWVLATNLIATMLPTITIWTIEGHRAGNQGTPLSLYVASIRNSLISARIY